MHTIKMGNWYYNAGIVGLLQVLGYKDNNCEVELGKFDYVKSGDLIIHDKSIEISDNVFEGMIDKIKEMTFKKYTDLSFYENVLVRLLEYCKKQKENKKPIKAVERNKVANEKGKMFKFLMLFNETCPPIRESEAIIEWLEKVIDLVKNLTINSLYAHCLKENRGFIDYSIFLYIGKVVSIGAKKGLEKVYSENIDLIKNIDYTNPKEKKNDNCQYCDRPISNNLSLDGCVSQIVAHNTDNTNWRWGIKNEGILLCPLCKFILSIAYLSFQIMNKKVNGDYKTFVYSVHKNSNIENMYKESLRFQSLLSSNENKNSPYWAYLLGNESIMLEGKKGAISSNNSEFIEMRELLCTKNYRVTYDICKSSLSYETANFFSGLDIKNIPSGSYKEGKEIKYIRDEILKKTIDNTLGSYDLNRYAQIMLREKSSFYFGNSLAKYIISYIKFMKGEIMDIEKNRGAFSHGRQVRAMLFASGKSDSAIEGTGLRMLNDATNENVFGFHRKYAQLCSSVKANQYFGMHDEFSDMDNFQLFVHTFYSGLMCKKVSKGE